MTKMKHAILFMGLGALATTIIMKMMNECSVNDLMKKVLTLIFSSKLLTISAAIFAFIIEITLNPTTARHRTIPTQYGITGTTIQAVPNKIVNTSPVQLIL